MKSGQLVNEIKTYSKLSMHNSNNQKPNFFKIYYHVDLYT